MIHPINQLVRVSGLQAKVFLKILCKLKFQEAGYLTCTVLEVRHF